MLSALIRFCAVLLVVGLVLVYLVGPILVATAIPFVVIVGQFCVQWGWVLALALALGAAASNGGWAALRR